MANILSEAREVGEALTGSHLAVPEENFCFVFISQIFVF